MNSHTLYDEALQILQKYFSESVNITEAKMKSEKALFTLLQDNPSAENDIRLAILHFYDQKGLGCFVHYDKKQLQIITRIKNYTHNLYVQRICDFLKMHKSTLYTQEPSKADFDELFSFVNSMLDLQNQSTKRDMIKVALRNVFGIQPRDGLFFKDGNIKLRKFDNEMVQISNEIRQINNRMHINVLSNADKQSIDDMLQSVNIQDVIMQNTSQILQNDIDLTHIDNILFNQRFGFFAIQKLRLFLEKLPLKRVDSIAKSMYCLTLVQQYSWVMFEIVAKELLDLCIKDNANAISFIEFYNGGSIELGGKIYTKPLIIDKNGKPWTLALIKEALHNKSSVEFDIQSMQKQANKLEERIHNLTNQIAQDKLRQKGYEADAQTYNDILENKNKTLRLLVDKKAPKVEIIALGSEINKLIVDKSHTLNTLEETQKNIATLHKEHNTLLSSQKTLQEQISYSLKKHKERFLQYDLLLRALGDAIANGKELV